MALKSTLTQGYRYNKARAFGLHVCQGIEFFREEVLVGSAGDKQVTCGYLLGEGAVDTSGEGAWDSLVEVRYAGRLLDPSTYHFHPGTLTTGTADPVQGVDSFVPGALPYNGSVYVVIVFPVGVDDPDISKLDIVARTSKIGDYDASGNRTAISYSANPARIKAFAALRLRKLPTSRINWTKFVSTRNFFDVALGAQTGGSTNSYAAFGPAAPTLDVQGPITANGSAGVGKATADGWDNYALTKQVISPGTDGYFQVVLGNTLTNKIQLVDSSGRVIFGVSVGNGHMSLFANSVAVDDAVPPYDYPVANGDTIRLATVGGQFQLRQNGVVKALPQGAAAVPAGVALYGKMMLWANGASITSSSLNGSSITSSTPTTVNIPRMEAHPVFKGPTKLSDIFDEVDRLSAGDTVDVGGKIQFLTPETRASVHHFIEGVNIREGTLKPSLRKMSARPTRLLALFRNLDLQGHREDFVTDTRDALFDRVGEQFPGERVYAPMHRSQAERLIKHEMRRESDLNELCNLGGMLDSYHVVKADVVKVTSPTYEWVEKLFLVITAKRSSTSSTAADRDFFLQEYAQTYFDADAGPQQQNAAAPVGSPYDPAPNPVLTLEQITDFGVGNAIVTKARGTIYFPQTTFPQQAKVFVTKPVNGAAGTLEEFTGQTIAPPVGKTTATFDYVCEQKGPYTFRVQLEKVETHAPGGSASATIPIGNQVRTQAPPASLSLSIKGQSILYTIGAPASGPPPAYYEIADGGGTIKVPRITGLTPDEPFTNPLANPLQRKVRAVDAMENASTWVSAPDYTGAAHPAPSLTSISSSPQSAEFKIEPNPATDLQKIAKTIVDVSTVNTFATLVTGYPREFAGQALTTGSISLAPGTYYIRARYVDQTGTAGTNSTTQSFTITAAGGGGTKRKVIVLEVGDGVNALAANVTTRLPAFPWASGTIVGGRIIADASGSAVADIKKATFATYPTLSSICASAKPTLSSASKAELNVSTWTTGLVYGDVLVLNLDSFTTVKQVTVEIYVDVADDGVPAAPPSYAPWMTADTAGSLRNNYTGYVGCKFTVGASALVVRELGRIWLTGNSGSTTVYIVRASDNVTVASAVIDLSGGTNGQFNYTALGSPVTLAAGAAYYLVSAETSGGNNWRDDAAPAVTAVATVNDSRYGTSLTGLTNWTNGECYVPVNFKHE